MLILRIITTILLLSLSMFSHAASPISVASYRGLLAGIHGLSDVNRVLGKPYKKQVNSNNVRYFYRGVDVTVDDSDGKIRTIIVNRDVTFVDVNGVRLGSLVEPLESKFGKRANQSLLSDEANGITYWIKDKKVYSIVLGRQKQYE